MIKKIPAIGFLLLSGCVASEPHDEGVSRVFVNFVEPEKFMDARRVELAPASAGVLRGLETFLIETGGRYLPATTKLSIRVTDIDLAGDFELFRGPQADQVRITKGLYPPRIVLEFELIDSGAKVIKMGKRNLTHIDYQSRSAYPREDYLRYEKDILRAWLRAELGVLNAGNSK